MICRSRGSLVRRCCGSLICRCGRCGLLIGTLRSAFAVAAAEQLHVVGHNLRHILLLPLLVVVGTCPYMTFHINLAALADELLGQVCQLPPEHEIVPFGILADLSVAVAVAVCGGKGEGGDFGVLSGLAGS